MIQEVLRILGAYLKEQGYTFYDPASTGEQFFSNSLFEFNYWDFDPNEMFFTYDNENYTITATWYRCVDRAFTVDDEISVEAAINILISCIASLDESQKLPSIHRNSDTLPEWIPIDDED